MPSACATCSTNTPRSATARSCWRRSIPQPYTPAEDEATADGLTRRADRFRRRGLFRPGRHQPDRRQGGRFPISRRSASRCSNTIFPRWSTAWRRRRSPSSRSSRRLPLDTGIGGMQAVMQGAAQPFAVYQELAQTYDTEMLDAQFHEHPRRHRRADDRAAGRAERSAELRHRPVRAEGRPRAGLRRSQFGAGASAGGGDPSMAPPASSSLPRLFQAWGIGFNADKVIGDLKLAQRVQASRAASRCAIRSGCISRADQFDARDPVTANMQVAQPGERRRAVPAQGRDHAFRDPGRLLAARPRCSTSNRCG